MSLVLAARWWDDIVFTSIGVGQLSELAHAWSSDRPPPEWQPRTREQNQAVLDRLGLTGPFWRLP